MKELKLTIHEALAKFKVTWKTLNQQKIDYLMQLGMVQEVMKVEERKAIRRHMEIIRKEKAEIAAKKEQKGKQSLRQSKKRRNVSQRLTQNPRSNLRQSTRTSVAS